MWHSDNGLTASCRSGVLEPVTCRPFYPPPRASIINKGGEVRRQEVLARAHVELSRWIGKAAWNTRIREPGIVMPLHPIMTSDDAATKHTTISSNYCSCLCQKLSFKLGDFTCKIFFCILWNSSFIYGPDWKCPFWKNSNSKAHWFDYSEFCLEKDRSCPEECWNLK